MLVVPFMSAWVDYWHRSVSVFVENKAYTNHLTIIIIPKTSPQTSMNLHNSAIILHKGEAVE